MEPCLVTEGTIGIANKKCNGQIGLLCVCASTISKSKRVSSFRNKCQADAIVDLLATRPFFGLDIN
jgi:hypothetical protein